MSRYFYKDASSEELKTLNELLAITSEVDTFVMIADLLRQQNPDKLVTSVLAPKRITLRFIRAGEEHETTPSLTSTSHSNLFLVLAATEKYDHLKEFFNQEQYQDKWEARVQLLGYLRNDDSSVSSFDRLMGSILAQEYMRWIDAGRGREPEAKELLRAIKKRGLQNPADAKSEMGLMAPSCSVM